MLSYLNVVYAFITDLVIWKEKFSVLGLLCTLTILVTAVSVAIYKFKSQKLQQMQLETQESAQSILSSTKCSKRRDE